jgi:putative two-component system response regulator
MCAQSKILIVDDDPITRNTFDALLYAENYELSFAENGIQALAKAAIDQPDVVLLDVMMPHMDGYEVCRNIRSIPSLAEVPVIMVTSLDDEDSKLAGLKAGADDFISKPFNALELIIRLQNMTRLNRYRLLIDQRREMERLHEELLIAYDKTIEGWSSALDLRDKETEGHTKRVAKRTVQLARVAGMDADLLKHIWRGGMLHDVGKLGIPDAILLKPGKLNEQEWATMRMHPVHAYEWLNAIEYLRPALDIPYCHHEKWDGSGYPRGLKGEEIPLAARLFAIVDVWDALTSWRPYRDAMDPVDALQYIVSQSGSHFDPRVVALFVKLTSDGRDPAMDFFSC